METKRKHMSLVDYIVKKYKKENGIDLSTDSMAMPRINEAATKALIELKSMYATEINIPFITADKEGPKHLKMRITEDWNKPEFSVSDKNEYVFQKHRNLPKKETKSKGMILIVLAMLTAVLTGILVFFLS